LLKIIKFIFYPMYHTLSNDIVFPSLSEQFSSLLDPIFSIHGTKGSGLNIGHSLKSGLSLLCLSMAVSQQWPQRRNSRAEITDDNNQGSAPAAERPFNVAGKREISHQLLLHQRRTHKKAEASHILEKMSQDANEKVILSKNIHFLFQNELRNFSRMIPTGLRFAAMMGFCFSYPEKRPIAVAF
jgi:hypothetical protein